MSATAAPVSVHSGIFVQSRLPLVLHRVIPSGILSLQNIGMLEAGVIGILIGQTLLSMGSSPTEMAMSAGVGAGAYYMAPP